MSSTKIRVLGVTGPAHSGKDTAADYLLKRLPHGFSKSSFACPIKQMARGLGLTHEQLYGDQKDVVDLDLGCTPRKILQTLGTDWGRELIHPNIWVRAMFLKLQALPDGAGLVMPDVRFENEAEFVRENGVLIHITGRFDVKSDIEAHVSEAGVLFSPSDIPVRNDGDLEAFYSRLDIALHHVNAD